MAKCTVLVHLLLLLLGERRLPRRRHVSTSKPHTHYRPIKAAIQTDAACSTPITEIKILCMAANQRPKFLICMPNRTNCILLVLVTWRALPLTTAPNAVPALGAPCEQRQPPMPPRWAADCRPRPAGKARLPPFATLGGRQGSSHRHRASQDRQIDPEPQRDPA
jgi:hypothetical protein